MVNNKLPGIGSAAESRISWPVSPDPFQDRTGTVMSERRYFKLVVSGEEIKLHTKQCKTRLCPEHTEEVLDDDGTVKARYVEDERHFIVDKPKGRKAEVCPVCTEEKIRERDRARRKKEREQVKDRSDCKHLAECLTGPFETVQDLQEEQCFDCVEYICP